MSEDEYLGEPEPARQEQPAPRRRRRITIYVSGWGLRTLILCGGLGAVAWGAILGDIWMWRLLYG